ncbi:universal stress protein [Massilia sp. GCM10020059]|uniref:Universal stress protein n=1 Tax=Massilia agrisoli TaxID=2892444 RepID=A0ABS8ITC1_9BURK|nr:universal stress protein [Massilia agrisoli]MCC6071691.1 universal stress protein [Massilia agrisoli]
MFKHILLPTDGSASSDLAVQAAVQLARDMGARVTGLHVVPPFHTFTYRVDMIEDTEDQYEKESEALARKVLLTIENLAQECGVPCDTVIVRSDDVHDAIIETARDRQCDLIAMASHGRRGVRGLLLGSETQKVLTHSLIPVLVYR